MLVEICWTGPTGYTPGLGFTYPERALQVSEEMAARLVKRGLARRVRRSVPVQDGDAGSAPSAPSAPDLSPPKKKENQK